TTVLLPIATNALGGMVPPWVMRQHFWIVAVSVALLALVVVATLRQHRRADPALPIERTEAAAAPDLAVAVKGQLPRDFGTESRNYIPLGWTAVARSTDSDLPDQGRLDRLGDIVRHMRELTLPSQLVLLGEPGSGKTIGAVQLALG